MKKILIVITKGEIGGAQAFVLNLATGLKKNNFRVTVALGPEPGDFLPSELKNVGIPIHTFKNLSRTFSPAKNLFFFWEAKKYLDKNSFDIVHLNSSNTLLMAPAAKLSSSRPKVVFTHHGLTFFDPSSTLRQGLRLSSAECPQDYGKGVSSASQMGKLLLKITFKFLLPFRRSQRFRFGEKSQRRPVDEAGQRKKIRRRL